MRAWAPRRAAPYLVFIVSLLGYGCAQRQIAAPPPGPVVDEPALMVPGDLDLVVRLDLARLRAVLGLEGAELLAQLARQTPVDEPDLETARFTLALFAHAETAWIGVRPGLAPELTDSVVVLRGNFKGVVPASLGGAPAWGRPADLGGAVLRFSRTAPKLRAAPSVIYARGSDLVVIGSEAEVDPLELGFQGKGGEGALRAPESGVVAVAARLGLLRRRIEKRAPTLSRLFDGADRLSGSVNREGQSFRVRAEVAFDAPQRAAAVADALNAVKKALGGRGREWLSRVGIDALGDTLSLSLDVSETEALTAIRCWQSAGC
ncbi:MAG TPA: hypothetical protein VG937_29480 [Polyangiaceae bacterium]|nr:hypothetical protein [Polyangiaceae bacterium]